MKAFHYVLFAIVVCLSCSYVRAEEVNAFGSPASAGVVQQYDENDAISFYFERMSLTSDSGSLLHEMQLSVARINRRETAVMPSNMVNVTGDKSSFNRRDEDENHWFATIKRVFLRFFYEKHRYTRNPIACYDAYTCYISGYADTSDIDQQQVLGLLVSSAEQHYAPASSLLANMCLSGETMPRDTIRGKHLLRKLGVTPRVPFWRYALIPPVYIGSKGWGIYRNGKILATLPGWLLPKEKIIQFILLFKKEQNEN